MRMDPVRQTSASQLPELTLSVFFEGTHNALDPVTTQVGWFFQATNAVDISSADVSIDTSMSVDYKMGFDGCGVVCGLLGTVWAFGLSSQCLAVVRRVHQLMHSGRLLRLNCFGLSRGGCACLMLAKRLAGLDRDALAISLCLFDPVPGNTVCAARYMDVCGLTTAALCMDVSDCRPMRSVLVLQLVHCHRRPHRAGRSYSLLPPPPPRAPTPDRDPSSSGDLPLRGALRLSATREPPR